MEDGLLIVIQVHKFGLSSKEGGCRLPKINPPSFLFGGKEKEIMFGLNNFSKELANQRNKLKKCNEYYKSNEYKRLIHLETLIIKAYESVSIKADKYTDRLNESFTREDYVEDFKVFFRPEVFNKLKEWCKEYEILREKEDEIMN